MDIYSVDIYSDGDAQKPMFNNLFVNIEAANAYCTVMNKCTRNGFIYEVTKTYASDETASHMTGLFSFQCGRVRFLRPVRYHKRFTKGNAEFTADSLQEALDIIISNHNDDRVFCAIAGV